MPIDAATHTNITNTYEKNKSNLADAIWFGAMCQNRMFSNDHDAVFENYEDEERKALGFDEGIPEELPEVIRKYISKNFMPDCTLAGYRNVMREILKAENRFALMDDALYQQNPERYARG